MARACVRRSLRRRPELRSITVPGDSSLLQLVTSLAIGYTTRDARCTLRHWAICNKHKNEAATKRHRYSLNATYVHVPPVLKTSIIHSTKRALLSVDSETVESANDARTHGDLLRGAAVGLVARALRAGAARVVREVDVRLRVAPLDLTLRLLEHGRLHKSTHN